MVNGWAALPIKDRDKRRPLSLSLPPGEGGAAAAEECDEDDGDDAEDAAAEDADSALATAHLSRSVSDAKASIRTRRSATDMTPMLLLT